MDFNRVQEIEIQVDDCEINPEPVDKLFKDTANSKRTWIFSFSGFFLTCFFIYITRNQLHPLLLWVEHRSVPTNIFIFIAVFAFVSFPFVWGYVLLNVALGYMYGVIYGSMTTSFCAVCGVAVAHTVMRRCFGLKQLFLKHIVTDTFEILLKIVNSEQGFKVVAFSRLTPIPFGLMNAMYALSDLSYSRYLSATFIGLLPTQILNSYIGSTLHSMEVVFQDGSRSITAYVVFTTQIFITVILITIIVRKGRSEFNKTFTSQTHPTPDETPEEYFDDWVKVTSDV